MAIWPTLVAQSDQPEKFDLLMQDGIEGHEVSRLEPGIYIVHGPEAQEALDALASRTGLIISSRETDFLDLEKGP